MNSSPERGRWNLRGNACKGDDIVVFVPFYKFTVKLLIGLMSLVVSDKIICSAFISVSLHVT